MTELAAPLYGQTCQAVDEHFDLLCGAPATVVGSNGVKSGYLCSDCANRAIKHGWAIGPSVEDVRDFLARAEEDGL